MATDYDRDHAKTEVRAEGREPGRPRRLTVGRAGRPQDARARWTRTRPRSPIPTSSPEPTFRTSTLSIEVTPKQADEFTCTGCFLVQHVVPTRVPGHRPLPRLRLSAPSTSGQAERVATMSANASRAARTGPAGTTARCCLASRGPGDDVGAGLVHGRVLAEQVEGLGVEVVVGEVAVEQLVQPRVGRVAGRAGHQHRQRRHALAQVGAGRLAGLDRVGGDVEDVVGELEGRADDLAVRRQRVLDLAGRATEAGAVAGGGGDQRAGLAGDDLEVVLRAGPRRPAARRSRGSGPRRAG